MTINLKMPDIHELKPRITVFGCGGGGGNAVNNMINLGLEGVDFVVANTDAQALLSSRATRLIQMGVGVTEGLGAGSQPEVGRAAAEEVIDDIREQLSGAHMCFITAGMGGGTGTGAAPVVARVARELGILTVGVVTKPFHFEGQRRMKLAETGIKELQQSVDTLIVIPNQNLFRIANEKTGFADAFALADQVLYSGVACITDLMVKEGLINLDFADVRSVMRDMGKAMMGTGEASGEGRARIAAEAAIANPLLDETSMKGARGLLISISGGSDMKLYEVDEAATRIREEVDSEANIILGATIDESLNGLIRVSVVATGIDSLPVEVPVEAPMSMQDLGATVRSFVRPAAPVAATPVVSAPEMRYEPEVAVETVVAPVIREQVSLRPLNHSRVVYSREPEVQTQVEQEPAPMNFIPPQAEQVQVRMPRIEEFPPQAQAHIQERSFQEERKPMSLIQRLQASGIGRREEEGAVRSSEFAKKPVASVRVTPVDSYGRSNPRTPAPESEDYEIPAFLRRNAR